MGYMKENARSRARGDALARAAARHTAGRAFAGAVARRTAARSTARSIASASASSRRIDIVRLVRLYEAEMTLRQLEPHIVAKRAEHFQPDTLEARHDQSEMARARDAIEDDAGDGDVVAIVRQARSDGRRRLGLAGDVRAPAEPASPAMPQVGRGAARRLTGSSNAVEQAHHALAMAMSAGWRATRSPSVGAAIAQLSRL